VLIDGPFPPPRTLPYTALAARVGGIWAGTVTTYANRVFPSLLDAGLFPELTGGTVRAEVTHGRSRFDFVVGDRFVEVKSVSLAEGARGLFPDAVSERAAKHCGELARLARRGQAPAIVFVAQRADVVSVSPAEAIDPAFAAALRRAARAGVLVLACALRMGRTGATGARRVGVGL
jgi:sugar fermentation stimulation protein A